MTVGVHQDFGGLGLSLLTTKLDQDLPSLDALMSAAQPDRIVGSAVVLAMFMAGHAASGQRAPVSNGALGAVLSAASLSEDLEPDDPAVAAVSSVYRARDLFLGALRDAVAELEGGQDHVTVNVVLWENWMDEDAMDVVVGVGLALERLYMLDMAGAASGDASDFDAAAAKTLTAYRRFVAAGQL